ncbi:IclR family transcriptional regulator domain-containing protein [Streptomyces filamentosus]|uniref:IclR family transcriptional regulator domain-containing protein n=1 Tax=Streptomyces filamentosus TaxID=67294 RepID=UPI00123ADF15|nr:IclR family transcriptional regulator C-terminal domain-containing protein [Streptomyces filamentosus]KAA6210633.1 IclR family transcriptional regulator [Streptomyces filamentosus]
MTTRPVEAVGPLERGLAVLRAVVAGEGGRRGVGEVARETGLARATVDRIATTLTVLGVLRTEGRALLLAPGAAGLGNAYLDSCGLPALLGPHAAALAERLDEPVSLAVPDGDGVRFLAQADRRRALAFAFRPGDLLPAERCAPGALFAAEDGRPAGDEAFAARVREARERGVAVDDQLIEPGLVSVALPVRDPAGAVVCAVSVAGHTRRRDAAALEALALAPLRETVAAMEAALALGAVPPEETPSLGAVPSGQTAHAPGAVPPEEGARGDVLKEELGAGFLRSLARGLDVLRAFGAVRGPARLTDLARLAGLPRATARRSLITLCHLGYVREDPGGFVLLPRVLGLGHSLLSALTLPDIATPHLVRLVRTVRESASVAVLDGDDIRYVARVAGSRLLRIDIVVGTRLPAYATSMGRVLLGALPENERDARLGRIVPEALTPRTLTGSGALREAVAATAERGFGWVEEELEEGLRSVAVPVPDGTGRVVAALNVALGAGRCTPEESLAVLLPQLRETAGRISADLAAVGRHAPVPTA